MINMIFVDLHLMIFDGGFSEFSTCVSMMKPKDARRCQKGGTNAHSLIDKGAMEHFMIKLLKLQMCNVRLIQVQKSAQRVLPWSSCYVMQLSQSFCAGTLHEHCSNTSRNNLKQICHILKYRKPAVNVVKRMMGHDGTAPQS